jgi:biotin carboxylase
VINGTRALAFDTSKARQLSLFRRLGADIPATRVVHRRADIAAAAAELRFPVLVKADIGGAGAGIERFDYPDLLQAAAETGATPAGVNGITLIQEYAPARGGRMTRIETLEGRFLYAIDIEGAGGTFDLCPADACLAQPGKPQITMTRAEPPAELIALTERIAQEAGLDVGGVEYLIDDRDGVARFYDLNALSNFVARPMEVLGFDPHEQLTDFLVRQIARRREAA